MVNPDTAQILRRAVMAANVFGRSLREVLELELVASERALDAGSEPFLGVRVLMLGEF